MSSFDDRKKGFESKFAHDEETLFKINAKRNKLLGEWVADKLNKTDKDNFKKVKNDLSLGGFNDIDQEIREKMSEFMEIAKKNIS